MAKRIGICLLALLLITCAIAAIAKVKKSVNITDLAEAQGIQGPAGQDGIDGINGVDGVGIFSIIKTGTSGNVDTYTITYTDNTTSTFTVTNGINGSDGINGTDGTNGSDGINGTNGSDGRGIVSILKTGTSGNVDTYTITYTDNTTSTFTVTNGSSGGGSAWTKITSNTGTALSVSALDPDKVYEVCVVGRHPMGDFTPCSTPVFFLNTDTSFMNMRTIICPALDDGTELCVLIPDVVMGNWTDFTVEWYFSDGNGNPDSPRSYNIDFYYREV